MEVASAGAPIGGRYQVISLLGRGGMGAVYRVLDTRSGSELALKRLEIASLGGGAAAELFEREFLTLSELAHPRIIAVHDYGIDEQGAYYTMELLGGQDLRERGKLPWREAASLLRDVASSLAILHSRRLLHCDVSPRNVRCTSEGRAKLLDFGAMAPMGATKRIVGTPPFIAPEMVQLQALDGRADLFGFGALAYWLLTGRHAYPARSLADLRDAWRCAPPPPAALESELPAALSELVMDCLQLNRNARPRSAHVVMERICAIASLEFDEREVAQAYLTTPSLVGRDHQLGLVRRPLARRPASGEVFCIEGPRGSGRSRMLDACVLEAKLLGWQVLRADAGDAGSGNYGAARALCEQLSQLAPLRFAAAARLHGAVLANVLGPELAGVEPVSAVADRRRVLSAMRDLILSVARPMQLLIAVDDADRIDEASASLLVALAQKSQRRGLSVALCADSEGEGSAALDALSELGISVALPPLSEDQSEQLVRSVFADASHTLTLARRLHAVAHGNPRSSMQLLEQLVAQGVVRYEAGAFLVPDHLREEDLPSSLAAALERRVERLDPDALELARALALGDPQALPPGSYLALTAHRDRARSYRALDQLVRAQILEPEGDRYRFGDAAWRSLLCAALAPVQRIELHARLAQVFESSGGSARRALHLMESEQPEAAIRVLLAQYLKDPLEPRDPLEDYVPGILDLLERAVAAAERLRLPAPWRVELRMKTAGASQFLGDLKRFLRIAPPLLAELERASGLAEYHALDASLAPMERLTQALGRTQARFEVLPESERGLAPVDAVRELARLCSMFAAAGTIALDIDIIERAPSLGPLEPLSPAIGAIQRFVDASRALVRGRSLECRGSMLELLERLKAPDRAGLGELYHKSIKLGALYIVGLIEASYGLPDAGARVAELEREPGHRVNAQRVHLVSQLMQGDFEEAAAAQRRAELVMLQDGQQQRYPGTTARTELQVHALVGDLAAVKQVLDRLNKTARAWPKWLPVVQLGQCQYRRLQGDFAGALEALEPGLAACSPLRYRDWSALAAAHVQVLTEAGRASEAAELGLGYLAICEREQLHGGRFVAQHTGEALLAAGRIAEAAALADALCAEVKRNRGRGLALGAPYELRARVAIARGDAAEFERCAERCFEEYRLDRNPALNARYERMLREASEAGLVAGFDPRAGYGSPARAASETAFATTVQSRMLTCSDAPARARCVLLILSEHCGCEQAYLYGVQAGRATFLCALPDAEPPAPLLQAVDAQLALELAAEADTCFEPDPEPVTVVERLGELDAVSLPPVSGRPPGAPLLLDASGGLYPVLLASRREGQPVIAGIACLRFRRDLRHMPPPGLLEALASALLEHDDVDPLTCLA